MSGEMSIYQQQCLLAYLGYYRGAVDGLWGSASREACRQFQSDYGLDPDGVCGALTQEMLLGTIAGTAVKAAEPENKTGTFWDDIKYFTRDEAFIGCPCGKCGGFPVEPTETLIRAADAVREHFGAPLIPTSTVRCPEHNAVVGGVKTSRHLAGRAMDFYVKGHGSAEVLGFVRTLNHSYAYAIDGGAVHMDF